MAQADFDFGEAFLRPWRIPGGAKFLLTLIAASALLNILLFGTLGQSLLKDYLSFFLELVEMEQMDSADPGDAFNLMFGAMGPLMAKAMLLSILGWFIYAATETAFHKQAFGRSDLGLFPLRFGFNEIRVMVVQLVIYVILAVIYLIAWLPIFFVGVGAAAAGDSGGAAIILLFPLLLFLVVGVLIFVGIRLSPAAALTVRDEDFRFFDGWPITRPYFWPMLGAFIVVAIVGYVATSIISTALIFGLVLSPDMMTLFQTANSDPRLLFEQIGVYMSRPSTLFNLTLGGIIYMAVSILWYAHFWGIPNYVAALDASTSDMSEHIRG